MHVSSLAALLLLLLRTSRLPGSMLADLPGHCNRGCPSAQLCRPASLPNKAKGAQLLSYTDLLGGRLAPCV